MMFEKMTSWVVVLMLLVGGAFVSWASAQDDLDPVVPATTPVAVEVVDDAMDIVEDVVAAEDDEEEDDRTDEEKQLAVADAVSGGLVVVQYHLQYAKGEDPTMYGSGQSRYLSSLIEQERPLEVPGFLLSDNQVLTADLILHPRFIKSITVSFGDSVVEATPSGWAMSQAAMLLALETPLAEATPLTFDASVEEELGVVYRMNEGQWSVIVTGVSTTTVVPDEGPAYSQFSDNLLLVDEDGQAAGISMIDRFDVGDESWKGSPLEWDWLDADAMALALDDVQTLSESVLVRVQLSFRSPPKSADMMGMGNSYEDEDTEKDCLGVLLDNGRVLVLESLRQRTTRRLERIMVHVGEGDPLEATFVGSLENYGALVAQMTIVDESLPSTTLATGNIRDWRGKLLMLADVKMQGDNRIAYFAHDRIISYAIGWQENIYPVLSGNEQDLFLFNGAGELVSFPIARRRKTTVDSGYGGPSPVATAAAQVAFLMADDLAEYVDSANVPVSEEDERKLAWIGVTLQGMDQDLAREYGVSDLTNDGANGAIVGHVYPGSPAELAGVEPDWVLLRLHVEGEPKPLEVSASPWVWEVYPFPWDIYVPGEVPVDQYDEIPTPWAPAETTLARKLTDLGFGTAFEAEFFVDGETIRVPFTVLESPAHYGSAPRYENEDMGMTVRDLTYEVRRYLRRSDEDPGVVVSKIEPGSLAAVAEIMPFEVITYVNGEAVYSIEDFEAAIAGQAQLRFEVLHMTQSRLAAIKMPVEEPIEEDPIEDPNELGDDDLDAAVDEVEADDSVGTDEEEVEEDPAAEDVDEDTDEVEVEPLA
jgi:hypothetical protein